MLKVDGVGAADVTEQLSAARADRGFDVAVAARSEGLHWRRKYSLAEGSKIDPLPGVTACQQNVSRLLPRVGCREILSSDYLVVRPVR